MKYAALEDDVTKLLKEYGYDIFMPCDFDDELIEKMLKLFVVANDFIGTADQNYEIARLNHSFERGLDKVTAEYSLREDGGLTIINKGFSTTENKWKEAKGKAYFVRNKKEGYLKESFFGPFYSSYVVFELDNENYQYAFVSGYMQSYLWLLSRSPKTEDQLIERFLKRSKELGFDTSSLLFITPSLRPGGSVRRHGGQGVRLLLACGRGG